MHDDGGHFGPLNTRRDALAALCALAGAGAGSCLAEAAGAMVDTVDEYELQPQAEESYYGLYLRWRALDDHMIEAADKGLAAHMWTGAVVPLKNGRSSLSSWAWSAGVAAEATTFLLGGSQDGRGEVSPKTCPFRLGRRPVGRIKSRNTPRRPRRDPPARGIPGSRACALRASCPERSRTSTTGASSKSGKQRLR